MREVADQIGVLSLIRLFQIERQAGPREPEREQMAHVLKVHRVPAVQHRQHGSRRTRW